MILNIDGSKEYSPEALQALTQAYDAVWTTLYAHMPIDGSAETSEMSFHLSQTLAGLAASGTTDFQDLRRKALEAVALGR